MLSGCYLFLGSVKMLRCCYDVLRENCYILSRTGMFSLSRIEIQFTINLADIFIPLYHSPTTYS